MKSTFKNERKIQSTRHWVLFFMISLIVSGITAIPLETGLEWVHRFFAPSSVIGEWLGKVNQAIGDTAGKYPFLFYGYDWLAFAHFVIALVFIGPYKDPVKNKWVIEAGIYACLLIIPFALLAGYFREIPFWWRLIDCSFGAIGLIPLMIIYKKIRQLEIIQSEN